jgi:hypothetical protein
MLDFVSASSYYTDLASSPVREGADGNLIHEFMEIERIMLEQSRTIGSTTYPQGSYQPYVCRVAGKLENLGINHECLDVASTKTMSSTSQRVETGLWNVSYTSTTGALQASPFVHTRIMVDITGGLSSALPSDVLDMFGSNVTECGTNNLEAINGKIMGDGVINSFDLYVIAAAQFHQGPYASLSGTPFAEVPTVQGRPDTKDRCCMDNPDCAPFDRLQWQTRVAWKDCYSYVADEGNYTQENGRRLLQLEAPQTLISSIAAPSWSPSYQTALVPSTSLFKVYAAAADVDERAMLAYAFSHPPRNPYALHGEDAQHHLHSTTAVHGWSKFGLYNRLNATHAFPVAAAVPTLEPLSPPPTAVTATPATSNLDARVFEYSVTRSGTWYWINIPSVHLSLEITLSSFGIHEGVALSNERVPNYMEPRVPHHPERHALRFVRHREFYDLDTRDCAAIASSRRASNAMENGVIYVGQSMRPGTKMCGFDLMVWKPTKNRRSLAAESPVCVVAGSSTMNGAGGSIQRTTACVGTHMGNEQTPTSTPAPPTPPPPSPSPTPSPPQYTLSFKTQLDMEVTTFNETEYKDALAGRMMNVSTDNIHVHNYVNGSGNDWDADRRLAEASITSSSSWFTFETTINTTWHIEETTSTLTTHMKAIYPNATVSVSELKQYKNGEEVVAADDDTNALMVGLAVGGGIGMLALVTLVATWVICAQGNTSKKPNSEAGMAVPLLKKKVSAAPAPASLPTTSLPLIPLRAVK